MQIRIQIPIRNTAYKITESKILGQLMEQFVLSSTGAGMVPYLTMLFDNALV
jgi:hypothetical protein